MLPCGEGGDELVLVYAGGRGEDGGGAGAGEGRRRGAGGGRGGRGDGVSQEGLGVGVGGGTGVLWVSQAAMVERARSEVRSIIRGMVTLGGM